TVFRCLRVFRRADQKVPLVVVLGRPQVLGGDVRDIILSRGAECRHGNEARDQKAGAEDLRHAFTGGERIGRQLYSEESMVSRSRVKSILSSNIATSRLSSKSYLVAELPGVIHSFFSTRCRQSGITGSASFHAAGATG